MKYITFLLMVSIVGCKNNNNGPQTTYTIKGRIMNGTTGQVLANMPISFESHTITKTPYASDNLGSTTTDSSGNFSFQYTQAGPPVILLQSTGIQIDGIQANK